MDVEGFRAYLVERGFGEDEVDGLVAVAERFDRYAGSSNGPSLATQLDAFSQILIDEGGNTDRVFWALALYGRFTGDDPLYRAILAFLDGAEALGNLHDRLGAELGEAERDRVFDGIALPPLGTPADRLPEYTERVMTRLEEQVDRGVVEAVLSECLRDLDDAWFVEARDRYEELGDVDAFLEWRREQLIETLERCHHERRPWFAQEITEAVLEYVREHPEISSGVRVGDEIVEVKIPHMTDRWLSADDDRERRYHYCHCPWVKETLRDDRVEIPAVFCACSAGFHKRFWEVVLGRPLTAEIRESVLAGDDRCTIAIRLPDDVVPESRAGATG